MRDVPVFKIFDYYMPFLFPEQAKPKKHGQPIEVVGKGH
jgi:hypothetical protein